VDYLDFEVEIGPGTGGRYDVSVLRSPAGEATESLRFGLDRLALENRLQALQIALLRSAGTWRRVDSAEAQAVQRFGQELWSSLFAGDILGRLETSRAIARQQEKGLRIKLRISAPELHALPWEYLYDANRGDFLTLSAATPLVRYVPLPQAMEPMEVRLPLRILGMVVTSDDLPGLDVERERARLQRALGSLIERGLVELVWLQGRTPRDLQQALRREAWHVFHFVGHGGFDETHREGLIVLADERGRSHRLSATDLGRLLGDHEPLRLAVLNSCDSARPDEIDVFSSTAATLVRRGTPAVVAMQYEITDDAAIEFSRSFYEALADGIPVDASVAEARKGVALSIPNTLEWGTPVLFMRAPDGVLFRLTGDPVRRTAPLAPVDETPMVAATEPEPAAPVVAAAEPTRPRMAPPAPPPAAESVSRAEAPVSVQPQIPVAGYTWTPPADPGRVLLRGVVRGFLGGVLGTAVGFILVLAALENIGPLEAVVGDFIWWSWQIGLLGGVLLAAVEFLVPPLRAPGSWGARAVGSALQGGAFFVFAVPVIVSAEELARLTNGTQSVDAATLFVAGAVGFVAAEAIAWRRRGTSG
jgi:hypothetical protein